MKSSTEGRLSTACGESGPGASGCLTIITRDVIIADMVRGFRDREAEKIFLREGSRALPADLQRRAQRKLEMLDAAESIEDLYVPPGNRLERLSGDRQGQWSIRINDRWRICFRWHEGDANDVEIVVYH